MSTRTPATSYRKIVSYFFFFSFSIRFASTGILLLLVFFFFLSYFVSIQACLSLFTYAHNYPKSNKSIWKEVAEARKRTNLPHVNWLKEEKKLGRTRRRRREQRIYSVFGWARHTMMLMTFTKFEVNSTPSTVNHNNVFRLEEADAQTNMKL